MFRSCLKRYMSRINVRLFSEGLQFAIGYMQNCVAYVFAGHERMIQRVR
jgi:hypothetical protein